MTKQFIKDIEGKAIPAPKFIKMNQFTSKTDYNQWIQQNTFTFDAPEAFWQLLESFIS